MPPVRDRVNSRECSSITSALLGWLVGGGPGQNDDIAFAVEGRILDQEQKKINLSEMKIKTVKCFLNYRLQTNSLAERADVQKCQGGGGGGLNSDAKGT